MKSVIGGNRRVGRHRWHGRSDVGRVEGLAQRPQVQAGHNHGSKLAHLGKLPEGNWGARPCDRIDATRAIWPDIVAIERDHRRPRVEEKGATPSAELSLSRE